MFVIIGVETTTEQAKAKQVKKMVKSAILYKSDF